MKENDGAEKKSCPSVKGKRVDFDGKYFEVHADDLVHANGERSEYQYVKAVFPWVLVVAIRSADEDSILVVRQYRHPERAMCIDLPGGMVDAGETNEATAHRELLEETGYRAECLVSLGKVTPFSAMLCTKGEVFLATGSLEDTGSPHLDVHEETLRHEWMRMQDIEMVLRRTPEQIGAASVTALLMARLMLGGNLR